MLKARRKFKKYMRIKIQQEQAVKKFEKNFLSLYHQKPGYKRKNKIDKLLQEQHAILSKERIIVGPDVYGGEMRNTK